MSIFLSYCRDNKPFADRLCRDLRRAELDVWMDDQIPNDQRWNDVLKEQIAKCNVVLLFASPEAAAPQRFVLYEQIGPAEFEVAPQGPGKIDSFRWPKS